jgi:aerobic-type carbon monoxide dehydrogenase small subunit (CoxS/CutS family)
MTRTTEVRLSLAVNGSPYDLVVPASTTLVELLRSRLGLTGTKVACDGGECGACTVLVDGEPLLSCLVLAAELDGCEITTIENSSNERIRDLQRAFVEKAGLQCGFCTPGIILTASRLPAGTDSIGIREALAGNICRCTGYSKIVDAVQSALQTRVDDD